MRRRAPLIAVVAVVVLVVAFFFLGWQPKNREIEDIQAETAQLEARRGRLENELRRLQEIEQRELGFREALVDLEEYIPSGPAQATAVRQFQLTADAAGVTVDSVAFAQPSPLPDAPPTGIPDTVLSDVTVTMRLEGGYFQVVDFFRRLEVDVRRAVLMRSVSMTESAEGFPLLSASWTGSLFAIIPDPEVVGAVEEEEEEEEPPPEEDGEVEVDDDDDLPPIDDDDGEDVS